MSAFEGDTAQVHNAVWAFPTLDCVRCDTRAWDPDQMYCETCIQMLGIQMAEDYDEQYSDTNS